MGGARGAWWVAQGGMVGGAGRTYALGVHTLGVHALGVHALGVHTLGGPDMRWVYMHWVYMHWVAPNALLGSKRYQVLACP